MTEPRKPVPFKQTRLHALLFAGILIILAIGMVIGLTIANVAIAPAQSPSSADNTTPAIAEPVMTGSLQINGETGYSAYLNGSYLGKLASPVQVFSGIRPGTYELTVEQFGITGSKTVVIEPDKTTTASIGLSKNQILLRMAKALNWSSRTGRAPTGYP